MDRNSYCWMQINVQNFSIRCICKVLCICKGSRNSNNEIRTFPKCWYSEYFVVQVKWDKSLFEYSIRFLSRTSVLCHSLGSQNILVSICIEFRIRLSNFFTRTIEYLNCIKCAINYQYYVFRIQSKLVGGIHATWL